MSFLELYQRVQEQALPVSTNWIRQQAIELSHITDIREQWSGVMEQASLRGAYIEGPIGPPVPRGDNEVLIILSREMCIGPQGAYWRRMVLAKELMHVFDSADEVADTEIKFEEQLERIREPTQASPQAYAESRAVLRALATLCPEQNRQDIKKAIRESTLTLPTIGAMLRLPQWAIYYLVDNNFEEFLAAEGLNRTT
jgi:hypothetical protein